MLRHYCSQNNRNQKDGHGGSIVNNPVINECPQIEKLHPFSVEK